MTSEERRAARRIRREEKRRKKKETVNEEYGKLENVFDYGNLLEAFDQSKKGVRWKCSVQRYEASLLRKTYDTHMKLLKGEDIRRGFHRFTLMERGKLREISSVHISERVVQRSLSDNSLVPVLTRTCISDNMACIKGKGTHAAINRVAFFLREYYRKTGSNEGVVVLIDFTNFFGNMKHWHIRKILEEHYTHEDMIEFIMLFVDAFGEVGCGLGSQVSQIVGTVYASKADHYAKEVLRIRAYVKYMDDTFMLFKTKEEADEALQAMFKIYESMGIEINKKKTRKVALKHGFTFLKTQFRLTETGKVIMRPCRQSITRERRKLKKLKKKLDEGRITFEEVRQQYQSWKGYMKHKMSWRTVQNMNQLFNELFIEEWKG
ncbi:MAG: RNA-directed DNA polymerase, partial [Bacteroidaceae bacterium]|nr:RNA-directed DNA polymerase [Bacteroidaceae bacterium]